jgi:hypothetical protein
VKTYFRPKQQVSIKAFGRPGAFDAEEARPTNEPSDIRGLFLRSSYRLNRLAPPAIQFKLKFAAESRFLLSDEVSLEW